MSAVLRINSIFMRCGMGLTAGGGAIYLVQPREAH